MTTRLLRWYTVAFVVGLVGVFVLPFPFNDMLWGLIGLASAAAVAIGVRRYRPVPALPWWLLCAAVVLFFAGDTVYDYLTDVRGLANPLPSVADVFYLGMYPVLVAGVFGLSRSSVGGQDRALPLDALILGSGLGLLSWVFLISPHLLDPDLTAGQRLVSVAYPVGDVLVLAAIGRLIVVHRFTPAVLLLTLGASGLLAADVINGMSQLRGHGPVGGPVDAGWLLFYGGWAAAALHPSMALLTRPPATGVREVSTARQVSLLLASLLPQIVLVVEASSGRIQHTTAIAFFATASIGLVGTRLLGLITSHRRALARADVIRAAGAAMVAVHDTTGVHGGVRTAIDRLLPAGAAHVLLVVLNDGGHPDLFTGEAPPGARLVATGQLPPSVRDQVHPFHTALICPLTLYGRPDGGAQLGVIVLAADHTQLSNLPTAVETVAAQAALALERIELSQEIVRRDNEQYFRALVQNTADVILIVDPDPWRVRYASPSAAGMFGDTIRPGTLLIDRIDPASRDIALEQLAQVRADQPNTRDWALSRPDDRRVLAEVLCQDLHDEPAIAGIVVTLRDVTDQRRLRAELTYRANHDPLTGLANRVAFGHRLREAQEAARTRDTLVGVLFVDLDDFKIVNDTLGHECGDQLLRLVARRLTSVVDAADTVARFGGDEFIVLLQDADSPATVEHTAECIIAAFAEPFPVQGRSMSGRVSVGIATTRRPMTVPDLLRRADLALYMAKNDGKGRWRRYEPALSSAILERLNLRADLEPALANGEFLLAYQPIVLLTDQSTVGFEALIRWNHPTRGLLMPGQFIELAEESDTIVAIGTWVLQHAITAAATWPTIPGTHTTPYVSVNVSARQFRAKGFADTVLGTLADADLPAARLMLELTETLLLHDDDHQIWNDLATLRDYGVRIAIDDFGTGYSALSYLHHTPIDVLKLDRIFTTAITASAQEADLVDGIIKLAHTMHLDVIAEGIEHHHERMLLEQFGCQFGQGYLFSRPIDTSAVTSWIHNPRAMPTSPT